jgi:small subunit ribosomal protein S21
VASSNVRRLFVTWRIYILLSSKKSVFPKEVFALAVGIKLRDNESIDRALRRFKRSVNRSRILRIYRSGLAYTKPSEEKRIERQKAIRNARKRRYDSY